VLLAGVALGQIAGNPFLRGRGLAISALLIGLADIILWVFLLGFIVPRSTLVAHKSVDQFAFPSPNILERAPAHIRKALEANVFLVVEHKGWPAFINTDTFSGSGIILGEHEAQFLILTNRHVVDPSFSTQEPEREDPRNFITAYFHDGSSRKAYVWWTAPHGLDLALVATGPDPSAIPIPEYEATREVEIGAKVFTVGNPHELSWTYTEGAISGVREAIKGPLQLRVIQTQAPINQGNSGGGLYSEDGTLIGIVSWTKDKAQAEGISFAIMYEDFLSVYNSGKSGPE
jgi:S1-C subfamily serine protease